MAKTLAKRTAPVLAALMFLWTATPSPVSAEDQVLATVGDQTVTAADLESAVVSSPLSAQFPSMSADDQAAVRGILLQRLVASRLLYLEAKSQGLDKSDAYLKDVEAQRLGLLYRAYMDHLRDNIRIPEDTLAKLKETYKDEPQAFGPAKSKELSNFYVLRRGMLLQDLKTKYKLQLHDDRVGPDMTADTVLAEADGFTVTLGDLGPDAVESKAPEVVHEGLLNRAELMLVAQEAKKDGLDVSDRLDIYAHDRLPSLLVEKMAKTWAPDEKTVRAYFDAHPEIGKTEERRHVGQIVLKTRKEAEAMRKRIQAGESLFTLAGEYSIDPIGRQNKGDVGWVKAGSGMPAIEAALKDLPDNEISEVVETPKGFHLITIIDRRPAKSMTYVQIKDKVRQALLDEKLSAYIQELSQRFPVEWALPIDKDGGDMPAEKAE